jgi:hypothetical protein
MFFYKYIQIRGAVLPKGKLCMSDFLGRRPIQSTIDMVKLLRVYGGCLGVERR